MAGSKPAMSESDLLKKLKKIVDEIVTRSDSGPFREPVAWKEWGLFDYPQIIKHPMDLGTVQKKLRSGDYKTAAECEKDVRLIWTNCMTYNQDGSEFFKLAQKFEKLFDDKCSKLRPGKAKELDKRPPTLDEKSQFSQSMYQITSEQLGRIVQILQKKCPKAIEKTGTDELEINIDSIDTQSFRELQEFIAACTSKGDVKGRSKKKGAEADAKQKAKRQKS